MLALMMTVRLSDPLLAISVRVFWFSHDSILFVRL